MISDSNQPCSNDPWYLIHCQPRKEISAANALKSNLGISVYIPEYHLCFRGHERNIMLFPNYIFAQADLQKVPLSKINTTFGVLRLVGFDRGPQPVPSYVIEQMRERFKDMVMPKHQQFCPGDMVRIKRDGPLQDLEMIFVGPTTSSQRVSVLLSFLGRLKEVYLDAEALEKVSSPITSDNNVVTAYHQRERYTRGKGRKINKTNKMVVSH